MAILNLTPDAGQAFRVDPYDVAPQQVIRYHVDFTEAVQLLTFHYDETTGNGNENDQVMVQIDVFSDAARQNSEGSYGMEAGKWEALVAGSPYKYYTIVISNYSNVNASFDVIFAGSTLPEINEVEVWPPF